MSMRLRRVFIFTAIVLGYFMALLDTTIINIALPEMTRHFGGTVSEISWVMNGYNLAFAALILTASRLADQFGRKKVFIIGVVVFTLASLLAGFSSSLAMLIVFRVIQGLAGAIIVPVTIPLTTTSFPKEQHGVIIGVWGAIAGLAAACGPSLGGMITEKLSWAWIFFVNVPLGLLSILLTLLFIKESRDDSASRSIDYGGMLGITGAMLALTYALIEAKDYGWNSGYIYSLMGAGLFCLLIFFYIQWKVKEPMLPLMLLRISAFNGSSLTLLIVGAALSNIALLTSFFLISVLGMTVLKAGLVLSMLAVGSIVSSAVSGGLSGKYGSRWFAASGVAVIGGATYSLSSLGVNSAVGDVLIRLAAAGIGVGLTMAPVMSSAIRHVPEEKVGIASGVINMSKAFGSVLGVAIIVTLFQLNINDQVETAKVLSAEAIQNDSKLLPASREILVSVMNKLQSRGGTEDGVTGIDSTTDSEGIEQSIEQAISRLNLEEQKTLDDDRQGQMKEIELVLSGAASRMQDASVQAFNHTFKVASYMVVPGILFALLSDGRRGRKHRKVVKGLHNAEV
ncbi:DHA2 family efflux MFS transporter permease subunit [Paenibacillus zeisoli]|uniref:DHA2 family efflux MFS transporter permease subunit n=1 Tax=Paenibacillus zeisoli TaxID=2496267 RepID=A0A433X670_9BACL|nr:MFS transporter [Paenibacillus zeisoli]RUT29626.1 DHA2 family efflux MFS transporter permease subunit [Paenibacillus zeisoli]